MLPEKFAKILELIRKTGDRLILVDSQDPSQAYALLNFDAYYDLIFSQEKIKQPEVDSASGVDPKLTDKPQNSKETVTKTEPLNNLTEEDLTDKINREISMWKNKDESPYLGEDDQPKKAWEIPPKIKNKAEEVV